MKNLLKAVLPILLLACLFGCSSSPTSNNNTQNNENTSSEAENVPAGTTSTRSNCDRPNELLLTSAVYNAANNYTLTYTWSAASGINNYEFKFFLNGSPVFENIAVSDTTITFTQTIGSLDTMYAEVKSNCRNGKSSSKQSAQAEYKNAIAGDEIIFLADPTKSVNDICQRNCQKIKFTGNTILNTDGSRISLKSNNALVFYLDFDAVKACIPCNGSVPQSKVDPTLFNSCLDDPVNELWIFDPNQYTLCP